MVTGPFGEWVCVSPVTEGYHEQAEACDKSLTLRMRQRARLRLFLIQQQHVNAAAIAHRHFHAGLGLARGVKHAYFELGVAEHTERYLVLAGLGREV